MARLKVDKHSFGVAACVVWAATVGMSVPFEMVVKILLNSEAPETQRRWHAFYVSSIAVALGGLGIIPLSLAMKSTTPIKRPEKWWHLCGGICALPAFFTISAGSVLGTEAVLVVQLASSLIAFCIIDRTDGTVAHTHCSQVLSLGVIVGGVVISNWNDISISGDCHAIVCLALVAMSGCGYALQAKCNAALADDVGSPLRATIVSACFFIIFGLPITAYICWDQHVYPMVNVKLWYLWALAGFQSAFYIGSYAYLPKVLGYTTCYLITLVAKMCTSLAIDASGLMGESIPVTKFRVCALMFVLAGAIMYNLQQESLSEQEHLLDFKLRK
jgi:uncharacterized membrane protein YdcZ (DUF606 family)